MKSVIAFALLAVAVADKPSSAINPSQFSVKKNPPNFVFFIPDELRADVVGSYGGSALTPNFDRLASEGIRFDQAHTSNPVCAQSRAAFLTGWPTHIAGHRTLHSLLHKDEPNMLKYLKQAGYEVRWWGKNDVMAPDAWQDSVHEATQPMGDVRNGKEMHPYGNAHYSMLYAPFAVGHVKVTCTMDNAKKHSQCKQAIKKELEKREMLKKVEKKGASLLEEWLDEEAPSDDDKVDLHSMVAEEHIDAVKTLSVDITVDKDTHDGKSVQQAIKFMKQRPANAPPFAVFLPLSFPHPPYSAPHPFAEMYNESNIGTIKGRNLPGKPEFHQLIRHYHNFDQLQTREYDSLMVKLRATYLGMVSYSDALLGRLLDFMDTSPLKDNTVIMVWSDHGDYTGDFGLVEKWPSGMEDVMTRVPLIIKAPGLGDDNKGARWKEPVQLYDTMATVMELAGITPRHVHFAKSLVKQIEGTATQADARKYVFAEGGFASFEPRDLESDCDAIAQPCLPKGHQYYPKLRQQSERPDSVSRAIMVRSKTAKLVWRSDPKWGDKDNELYDLVKDPEELYNVWDHPDYKGMQAELKEELLKWLATTSDVTPWEKDDRSLPATLKR
jgi:arylsulfatase A-like enzyme